jgi:VWFA-related protein
VDSPSRPPQALLENPLRIRLSAPLLLSVVTLCATTLCPAQAIQVPAVESQSPTIHQTVNNVLVDVVVTDKNGQPLRGLSKDRFQVVENGTPQQIAFFEEHQAEPAPPPIPHLQLPANVYTNISSTAPDNGPILVLLMDALNTPLADQVHVRAAMLSYLRTIPTARHIAIFTLTSKLRMVQGFNGDPATLIAALDQVVNWQKQSHLTDDRGTDSYADTMPKLGIGSGGGNTADVLSSFVAHEQAWKIDQRVSLTLEALNTLATYLSALPGRKNLIWFSGSFPLGIGPDSPLPAGFDASKFVSENLDRSRDYNGALTQTSELLKVARVAVYPVAAGGLQSPSMFNSTRANNDSLHGGSPLGSITAEASEDASTYATMDTLAESTGGRAFHSTNDLAGAIASVNTLASTYYTIAYSPKDKNYDSKYRKLVIKVDAPKAKVDYRRGYYAQDPAKLPPNAIVQPTHTSAALLHGAPADTDILFKVRVAPTEKPPASTNAGVVRYSVNWSVDLHSLNLQESSSGMHRGDLGLAIVAYNSDFKAINSVSTPASLILEPDEYRLYLKSGLQFHQEIELPIGNVSLRVAIVNSTNNRAGATEIPLTIQPLTASVTPTPTASH